MDSSSSASSSSTSQYKAALFPASGSGGRPRWPDLPIYESAPHYSSNYTYDYANRNFAGGDGGSTAAGEKRPEEEDEEAASVAEREHMFDKVVTPSDVGKLNRLVIPKQHAEKYFPLDSSSGDSKGLLLNFEDRTGKSWRFRYSYWNSSQSYVMTKGWSRFVKEKKLDAGDIVSFHRDSSAKDRFFIDWRRRPDAPPSHHHHHHYPLYQHHGFSLHRPFYLSPPLPPPPQAREQHHYRGSVVSYNGVTANYGTVSPNFCNQSTGSVIYLGAVTAQQQQQHQQQMMPFIQMQARSQRDEGAMVFDSVPVVHGGNKAAAASSKRLRLFGVNMDCTDPLDECEQKNRNHHDLVLDSDRISSSSAESALQLRLHGSGISGASTSDFVDKGKSSMSLDLDI